MGKEKSSLDNLDLFKDNALEQAKEKTMAAARDKGCGCPVCGQFVKVYRRPINSGMARQLIHVWRMHGTGKWFHTRDAVMERSGAGDFSKLEWWGLIKGRDHDPADTERRTSGLWMVTPHGEAFLRNNVQVQKWAIVYNNEVLEMTGPMIGIADALGKRFNYRELMGSVEGIAA